MIVHYGTGLLVHILIQPADDVPIYRQIVRQVLEALASGRLEHGERMPSQRELAQRLVVSPLTVKKAYDELERAGVLETRRGQGTFVAAPTGKAGSVRARVERMAPLLRRLLGEAWAAQVPLEALIKQLRVEAARLDRERTKAAGSMRSRRTPAAHKGS